jgi:hypothetical protein
MKLVLKREILLEKKGNSSIKSCALISYESENLRKISLFGSAKPVSKKIIPDYINSRFRNIGSGLDYENFTIELPYNNESLEFVKLINPIYDNNNSINFSNLKKDFEVSFFDNFGKLRLKHKMIGCFVTECNIYNSFIQKIIITISFDYITMDYIDCI